MVFGEIEYLNLLPFHVFMKRFTRSSQEAQSMHYKRGVPADINARFLSRKLDGAFISSISAKNHKNVKLGIIAKKEVLSVIVVPNATNETDKESASSNVLARILNIHGKILIGDKALAYSLKSSDYVDLAQEWYKKHNLPFVFALLCFHTDKSYFTRIEKRFLDKQVKIPQYILQKASLRTGIEKKDILHYLKYISYELDTKAKQALKKFYRLS